jgi:S-methylmethionine-dependent homocysteine/selenocysteine methylase
MTFQSSAGALTLLDGATATELQRRGIAIAAPWWATAAVLSDRRRQVLRAIHEDYLEAGADVLTTNTFRAGLRTLLSAGLRDAGLAWMVHAAIGVAMAARNAAGSSGTTIVGSLAPVADCYRPDLVPSDEELRAEHRWLATELSRGGVRTVLIETMNTLREARIAVEQVLATGAEAWVSFVCDDRGRLLSGEPLAESARAVESDGASAVLVNCTAVRPTALALAELAGACRVPIGAYPNLEDRAGLPEATHVAQELRVAVTPEEFAEAGRRWVDDFGVRLLGGCCGSTPDHLRALRKRITS